VILRTGLEKPKRYRDPKYLAYIRMQDCIGCGVRGQSVPHHARNLDPGRPTQSKVSDYNAVPMCVVCHDLEHRGMGMDILELYQAAFDLLRTWVEEEYDE
jgi:Fe-S-cluster-containing dehydrogenase component